MRTAPTLPNILSKLERALGSIDFRKQYILLFCLSTFFMFNSKLSAQEASTSVNIVLADILSIDPSSAANNGTVDFNYATVADYNSEKVTTVPKSLIFTFSKPFDVRVKASGEHFENGNNRIPVNVLTIRRNPSSTIAGTSSPIVLSTTEQILVSGAPLGHQLELDLDYIIPESKSSSSDILGKPAGTYTQKVTYTATAL